MRRDFGDRAALDGVDLRVDPGGSLAVLGPNGSGKSTLLRILAGLLRPSSGEVSVLGCDLPKETHRLRGRVGYLGHDPLLYRDLTPRENLELVAALHGIGSEVAGPRIEVLLEAVGMSLRADDRVAELSAGMKQRIDICRAVLHEPELLLLDEPDAHLDPEARLRIAPLIAAGNGRTRVVVSHERGVGHGSGGLRSGAGMTPFAALLRKDLRVELRTLRSLPAMALFAVTTFVIFRFGLDRTSLNGELAAGVLVADAAVRCAARDQPAVRRRARGGRIRPRTARAGRPHRPLRGQGERPGDLPRGRSSWSPSRSSRSSSSTRPLGCSPSPSSCCWRTSAWPRPEP